MPFTTGIISLNQTRLIETRGFIGLSEVEDQFVQFQFYHALAPHFRLALLIFIVYLPHFSENCPAGKYGGGGDGKSDNKSGAVLY